MAFSQIGNHTLLQMAEVLRGLLFFFSFFVVNGYKNSFEIATARQNLLAFISGLFSCSRERSSFSSPVSITGFFLHARLVKKRLLKMIFDVCSRACHPLWMVHATDRGLNLLA